MNFDELVAALEATMQKREDEAAMRSVEHMNGLVEERPDSIRKRAAELNGR